MSTKELPNVQLNSHKAKELADMYAVMQDLDFVVLTCTKLIQIFKTDPRDMVLIRGLYSSALVAYARCFATGLRTKVSPEIFAPLEGASDCHKYYKNMRDKLIAHSVNPFEETYVAAVLGSDGNAQTVVGLSCFSTQRISDDENGVVQLGRLATHALDAIKAKYWALHAEVLKEAKSIGIEELKTRNSPKFVAPSPDKSGHARTSAPTA